MHLRSTSSDQIAGLGAALFLPTQRAQHALDVYLQTSCCVRKWRACLRPEEEGAYGNRVCTREPPGSRASTQGGGASTRRPRGATMRSITWRTASSPSSRRSATLSIHNRPYAFARTGPKRRPYALGRVMGFGRSGVHLPLAPASLDDAEGEMRDPSAVDHPCALQVDGSGPQMVEQRDAAPLGARVPGLRVSHRGARP
jgi:hypothetical protein